MDFRTTLTTLYYLLIYADGNVNERELNRGRQMVEAEGLDVARFEQELEQLKSKNSTSLYNDCLVGLRRMDTAMQIRSIAWLCVVANADGFMDKEEWILIYRIYHTELKLSLDEIMKTQKELNKIIHGKPFHSLGVRVAK
jgi:uncharacterized tellurite resistance protein B-like protein